MIKSQDLIYFHECVKALTRTTPFELIIKCVKDKQRVTLFAEAFGNQVWGQFKIETPNKDSYSYSIPYKDVEKLFKANVAIGLTNEGVTFFSGRNKLIMKPAFAQAPKFVPIEEPDLDFNKHLYQLTDYAHFIDMGEETMDGKPTYFVAHDIGGRQAYISSNHASAAVVCFKSKSRFAKTLPLSTMQRILKACSVKHETNRFTLNVADDRMTLDSDCIFASLANLPPPSLDYGGTLAKMIDSYESNAVATLESFDVSFMKDDLNHVVEAAVEAQELVFSLESSSSKKQSTVPLLSKTKLKPFRVFMSQFWPFNSKLAKWKGFIELSHKSEDDTVVGFKINREGVTEELYYVIVCASKA